MKIAGGSFRTSVLRPSGSDSEHKLDTGPMRLQLASSSWCKPIQFMLTIYLNKSPAIKIKIAFRWAHDIKPTASYNEQEIQR